MNYRINRRDAGSGSKILHSVKALGAPARLTLRDFGGNFTA